MATLNRTYTPPPPRTLVRSVGMPGSGARHRAGAPADPPGRRPFMPAPQWSQGFPVAVGGPGPLTRGDAAVGARYGVGAAGEAASPLLEADAPTVAVEDLLPAVAPGAEPEEASASSLIPALILGIVAYAWASGS